MFFALLRMNKPLKEYARLHGKDFPSLHFPSQAEWDILGEVEAILELTKLTTKLTQTETGYTGSFGILVRGLTMNKLRESTLSVVRQDAVTKSPRVIREDKPWGDLSPIGKTCMSRANLEGERRYCGNETEIVTSTPLSINNRESLATLADVRTKGAAHVTSEQYRVARLLFLAEYVDYGMQRKKWDRDGARTLAVKVAMEKAAAAAQICSAQKAAAAKKVADEALAAARRLSANAQAFLREAETNSSLLTASQLPAASSDLTESGNATMAGTDTIQGSSTQEGSLNACMESYPDSASALICGHVYTASRNAHMESEDEDDDDMLAELPKLTEAEQDALDKAALLKEAKKVYKKWREFEVSWHAEFPDDVKSWRTLTPDLVHDLMKVDVGKIYARLEEAGPDGSGEFGLIPLMANGTHCNIGAMMAESFCERIISMVGNVIDEGNTLLKDRSLERLTVLRMNREFMSFMRAKYPDLAKQTFKQTVVNRDPVVSPSNANPAPCASAQVGRPLGAKAKRPRFSM